MTPVGLPLFGKDGEREDNAITGCAITSAT